MNELESCYLREDLHLYYNAEQNNLDSSLHVTERNPLFSGNN